MQFRCPSCGVKGAIRIPEHLPRGKTARIRCSRCRHPFPLSLGKLFPQEQAESYQALVPGSLDCRGRMVGRLWVECAGPDSDSLPLLALPAHPALSHEILHDLLDPFRDYFRICYVEFPGSGRNRVGALHHDYASWFLQSLEALQQQLKAKKFHLLAHLSSARLALRIARAAPAQVASLILIDPDLCLADRKRSAAAADIRRRLSKVPANQADRQQLLLSLIRDLWASRLEEHHMRGLARILAPGFPLEHLRSDLLHCGHRLTYRALSRLKAPLLIYSARDGSEAARRDALYLQASVPLAEIASLERGGAWTAWFGGSFFANKLLAFKRSAAADDRAKARRRGRTLNGQPLGWMIALFILLAGGLSFAASLLSFQPPYLQQVLPPLLAGLLPILWFLVPKKLNPLLYLRFRALSFRSVLLPLAAGGLIGLFYTGLLQAVGPFSLPGFLPAFLISPDPGAGGRLPELAALGVLGLFVFGVAENLLLMRRHPAHFLVPALLFALLPPSFPDFLWRLPLGLMAALLFAANLSIFCALFLLAGFALAGQWGPWLQLLPFSWQGNPAVAASLAPLALSILLGVLLGVKGREIPGGDLYFQKSRNRKEWPLRWDPGLGVVVVAFSLIAAAALIFAFLAA